MSKEAFKANLKLHLPSKSIDKLRLFNATSVRVLYVSLISFVRDGM
jgi:hypothetical protein